MKLNNIFSILSLAAVALANTGCQDTDAQVNIPDVNAPIFVSVTPDTDDALLYGEKTIQVAFDKNIGFATKNTSLITLNNVPVKKASVIGASNILTIVADVDFKKQQTLHIPAGIVVGPSKKVNADAIDITWTPATLAADNPAVAMTKKLGWGWNLGNHFDTSDTQWGYWDGATPTAATFQAIANAGGKTVRIPVTWTNHMDAGHVIAANYLDEVAGVVDLALAAGLNVILNTHHDSFETNLGNAAGSAEVAKTDSALIADLWTQVATRFANYGESLIFETFNEVHAGDNWSKGSDAENALLNLWNQYAVKAIRSVAGNENRWIGISHYAANIDQTIANLQLPEGDSHIMVGVHCYDPYNFCLAPEASGTNSWGHNADPAHSVSGTNEEYVIEQLYKLRKAYIAKGIPCYLGEYGCVWQTTELANKYRAYYLEFFCRAANLASIPMFVWDNNAKGSGDEANGYIDHATGAWVNDSETLVPTMVKACTSDDDSYGFEAIWAKSPTQQ